MKAKILFTAFFSIMFANIAFSKNDGKLEVMVSFERQDGLGSNQYAVWIEDDAGKLVKTLYVTRFTAEGGYVSRPGCTPQWVEKADAQNMSKEQVDVFSGATPVTGDHTYTWDLTDDKGNKVAPGKYTFIVQGTYFYPDSQVLFKGSVDVSTSEDVIVVTTPEYSTDEVQNKGMIRGVIAKYNLET
ncbi:MAG: DUF2271 domain-containing protein [Rikenellaceae bacterium]|nr:DUF2271 domain-containing protein [Rikenellaceae bacterium]